MNKFNNLNNNDGFENFRSEFDAAWLKAECPYKWEIRLTFPNSLPPKRAKNCAACVVENIQHSYMMNGKGSLRTRLEGFAIWDAQRPVGGGSLVVLLKDHPAFSHNSALELPGVAFKLAPDGSASEQAEQDLAKATCALVDLDRSTIKDEDALRKYLEGKIIWQIFRGTLR